LLVSRTIPLSGELVERRHLAKGGRGTSRQGWKLDFPERGGTTDYEKVEADVASRRKREPDEEEPHSPKLRGHREKENFVKGSVGGGNWVWQKPRGKWSSLKKKKKGGGGSLTSRPSFGGMKRVFFRPQP